MIWPCAGLLTYPSYSFCALPRLNGHRSWMINSRESAYGPSGVGVLNIDIRPCRSKDTNDGTPTCSDLVYEENSESGRLGSRRGEFLSCEVRNGPSATVEDGVLNHGWIRRFDSLPSLTLLQLASLSWRYSASHDFRYICVTGVLTTVRSPIVSRIPFIIKSRGPCPYGLRC